MRFWENELENEISQEILHQNMKKIARDAEKSEDVIAVEIIRCFIQCFDKLPDVEFRWHFSCKMVAFNHLTMKNNVFFSRQGEYLRAEARE